MTLWGALLLASLGCFVLKLAGYLVPRRALDAPRPARITDLLTVALLAALVAVQTFADGRAVVIDARLPAVLVAAALLWFRLPFLVVVFAGALVAAALRALGLAA